MSVRNLIESFARWRAGAEPLALATVFETAGSTYSKAGHRILIAANGDYRGLVSGGCLEGDLAERARAAIESGRSRAVTYDLRDEADELWGLGIGCNGLLRVFLQPLVPASGYEPFATIAECLSGTRAGGVATLVDAPEEAAIGSTVVQLADGARTFGPAGAAEQALTDAARQAVGGTHATLLDIGGLRILASPLRPIPRLLVLGAGLDAVPLVAMAAELGWTVTVADHRPAYVARPGFERAAQVALVEPGKLGLALALAEFDAVVVMSHHLATDRKYLAELASVSSAYLGVLGPRARRDRLLRELAEAAPGLGGRLKGPVGLDIGADSPETIALAILAELQTTIGGR